MQDLNCDIHRSGERTLQLWIRSALKERLILSDDPHRCKRIRGMCPRYSFDILFLGCTQIFIAIMISVEGIDQSTLFAFNNNTVNYVNFL